MTINEIYSGFKLLEIVDCEEINAKLHVMEHEKTGARLAWLDRDSLNKTFGICFRTIPEDDTGVFHILEHSVLCGSDKFPVKEPFVELLKNSLQTFLNAMTYPDKTFYPISSRNDKDFMNMVRVYMDAVFHPAIYNLPEIFCQEGWHYELDENDQPTYKGVVFNEMKGAFSSADTLLLNELCRRMYPDTCYKYVSGGDPAYIPELTYEQFIATHQRFYHPSNSYILLDGSVDVENVLAVLNDEFLASYDKIDPKTEVEVQAPVNGGESTIFYELSEDESMENKARAAWAYGFCDFTDRAKMYAFNAVTDVICGSNQSKVKQAVLSKGLAEDVFIGLMDGIRQPFVLIEVRNFDEKNIDEIKSLIDGALKEIIAEGVDKEFLTGVLANMELRSKERDYGDMPQGLGLETEILDSWLYGGRPEANLSYGPVFEELKANLETDFFEKLLENTFFNNEYQCRVLMLPSRTLGDEQRAAEAGRLKAAADAWSAEDLAEVKSQQESLISWQQSEDTEEGLATLPHLEISDISEDPEDIPTEEFEVAGTKVLRHKISTGGISYVRVYFDISDYTGEELANLDFACSLLSNIPTEKYDTLELQKKISLLTGYVSFSTSVYNKANDTEGYRAYACASFSALDEKVPEAMALVTEIMTTSVFEPSEVSDILVQTSYMADQSVVSSGHSIGNTRVASYASASAAALEYVSGFTYVKHLKKLANEFEEKSSEIIAEFEKLVARAFRRGRNVCSVTGEVDHFADLETMLKLLPEGPTDVPVCMVKKFEGPKIEGIVIPSDVSYAECGANLNAVGVPGSEFNGKNYLGSRIVSLAYLWNAVRVQGGAYGTGLKIADSGDSCFYSYRDPSASRSLGCYKDTPNFIREFVKESPDLTGFIIGAISTTEPLLLPRQMGGVADRRYFKGITFEDLKQQRKDILTASASDFAKMADYLEAVLENGHTCVVGPREEVEACGAEVVHTL